MELDNKNCEERMVSIPIDQYAQSIMALQKLIDIAWIARQSMSSDSAAVSIVNAIRAITENDLKKIKS